MRITTLTATVAAVIAMVASAPGAIADSADAVGVLCDSNALDDPTVEPGTRVGEITGGPIYGFSQERPVTGVYLICTIQVGANSTHAGADAVSLAQWGTGVVTIPPTVVSYAAPEGSPVYMCSEVWVDTSDGHVTLMFNATDGDWSLSSSVDCELLLDV